MRRRRDPTLERFLLDGEKVVVDVRQHWAVIALPVLYAVAGLAFVMWADHSVRLDGGPIARGLWLLWFGLAGWTVFQIAQWRHDRFIATNKRLLLDYGLFTTKVAMMPLTKVTDMSYQRTVAGRLLGFGRFILESAGQEQALRQVDWIPRPDQIYRIICHQMFGVDARDVVVDPDRDDGYEGYEGSDAGGGDGYDSYGGPGHPASPLGGRSLPSAVEERRSWSRAIPLHDRGTSSPIPSGEVIYSSDDDRRRRRMADTGPIPTSPPRPTQRPPQRPTHRPVDDDD